MDKRYLCELQGFARTALEVVLSEGVLEVHLSSQRLLPVLLVCLQSRHQSPVWQAAPLLFTSRGLHQEADSLCPQLSSQGAEGQRGHSKQEHQEQ